MWNVPENATVCGNELRAHPADDHGGAIYSRVRAQMWKIARRESGLARYERECGLDTWGGSHRPIKRWKIPGTVESGKRQMLVTTTCRIYVQALGGKYEDSVPPSLERWIALGCPGLRWYHFVLGCRSDGLVR